MNEIEACVASTGVSRDVGQLQGRSLPIEPATDVMSGEDVTTGMVGGTTREDVN